jgi:predicted transcriptional regulator
MKVNEIITHDPQVIRPETALIEAAQKMKSLDIGMLPVCDGDRLVGIVSLGDLAVRTGKEKLAGEVLERVSEPGHLRS